MQTTMTPAEWGRIPGNPRQRNTEDRVKKAKHLFTPSLDQRAVKMARLPDGQEFKIDGHTRDLFWRLHPEMAPPELWVTIYPAADYDEVLSLYDHCDSAAALETATDKVFGSFRENEFSPASPFMRMGRIAASLRLAYGIETHWRNRAAAPDVHKLVEHWMPELKLLDELVLNTYYFNVAIVTAALLTLRRYGVAEFSDQDGAGTKTSSPLGGRPLERTRLVREFWERYARLDGTKTGRSVDAIEALRILVERNRAEHAQKSTVQFIASRAVGCVERYLIKRGYKLGDAGGVTVKGVDLSTYFPVSRENAATRPAVTPQLEMVHP